MGSRGSPSDPHHLFPGSLRSNHPQPWLSPHSPLGSVSWTPRSSLARSWAWAPSAPESASSPEALLMPARPVGCIPEGCGVSGMGGAWCERCWVWSWCWRGEERAESKGCARTAAGQVRGKRQPWISQQWGLVVEGQGPHPGHPQECSGGHHVPPTDPSHPGLDGGPCLYPAAQSLPSPGPQGVRTQRHVPATTPTPSCTSCILSPAGSPQTSLVCPSPPPFKWEKA